MTRRRYLAFYAVTAVAFSVIALAHLGVGSPTILDPWPGRYWWAAGYGLVSVAAAAVVLGTFATTIDSPGVRFARAAGALLSPVLALRGAVNLAVHGSAGIVGSAFLLWAAAVLAVWGPVLFYLPQRPDAWWRLRSDLDAVRHDLDHLNPEGTEPDDR